MLHPLASYRSPANGNQMNLRFASAPPVSPALKERLAEKRVAICLDNDDTLTIHRKYQETVDETAIARVGQTLNNPLFQKDAVTFEITGRGPDAFANVGHYQKNIRPDFLGLDDGRLLVVNAEHKTVAELLKQGPLREQQDPDYERLMQQEFHWNADVIDQQVQKILQQEGFQPLSKAEKATLKPLIWDMNAQQLQIPDPSGDRPPLLVEYYPKATGFFFHRGPQETLTEQDKQLTHRVTGRLLNTLEAEGTQAVRKIFPYAHTELHTINPVGVNKHTLFRYVVDHYLPQVQALVAAGDTANDEEILAEADYPIQVGNNPTLKAALAHNPNYVQVPPGQLAQGLQQQLERVHRALHLSHSTQRWLSRMNQPIRQALQLDRQA
ncbi:MAG: HAD family hydrolase [Candidatus Melainabacteria bacterium]|nr:HAD family hydrolase [Candidatus Melainabacteria bacterium]